MSLSNHGTFIIDIKVMSKLKQNTKYFHSLIPHLKKNYDFFLPGAKTGLYI